MKFKLILAIFLFLLTHFFIFYFALSDVSINPIAAATSNYYMHFLAFFGLSFLFSLILLIIEKQVKYPFSIAFLYSVFISILVEMLQVSTSTRFFSYFDILVGVIGASFYSVFGVIAYNYHFFEMFWY